ncbi:MAG: glycine betaine ABC transporter substrate-binding protein [Cyanobacteria bacterium P01_A01_bin.3]
MSLYRRSLLGITVIAGLALAGCGSSDTGIDSASNSSSGGGDETTVIRVGSKDFTEQFIIGEMYALVLEENGFDVERRLNLGGTPVAHAGLQSEEIDLYPEYTGTALLTVLELPSNSNRDEVFSTVSEEYLSQFDLVWLDPAPMNNTQALAVTQEVAKQYELETISDMAAIADQLVMVGPPEFELREDGLPGLQAAYGDFELSSYKGVDPGLRYISLSNGEADVAVAFGTDGEISAFNLVVLEDDQNLFPPYQVAPVVRQEIVENNPELVEALNELTPLLTDRTMRTLNSDVSGKELEPEVVARRFLEAEGLLSSEGDLDINEDISGEETEEIDDPKESGE